VKPTERPQILDTLRAHASLTRAVIADVGSGTGILPKCS
jgi:hypothetical protein